MVDELRARGVKGDGGEPYELLAAADRVTSAAMWLVVHETYTRRVYLDGRELAAEDFKADPEGHTGGALNMVPAYAGYLAANALTGITRSWLMGQGHCVAAIDSLNLLLGNTTPAHDERYSITDEGLTRYVNDFYSYRLNDRGEQDSPLGSHVNVHTAGGMMEGGYLGFAELQYVHMPLRGEHLVAFLSDGAFEEQRGSDWIPRWWRASDTGLVVPIMIANGRRIDQRTTMSQQGGIAWFERHLELNSFDPLVFDGTDPAAFVWAIFEIESRLAAAARAVEHGDEPYPVRVPYGIAVSLKGAGFYGAGTNLAHNLPLGANPRHDARAARHFNRSARRLWVPLDELNESAAKLQRHSESRRPRERDHALAHRSIGAIAMPRIPFLRVESREPGDWRLASPMVAIDESFAEICRANPHLRPRVGNPDEMKSNRMLKTLDLLRFRVTDPEAGIPESIDGAVITALNEEAVVSAALANKGGLNISVTYEAFAPKMLGAMRQEITFAVHLKEVGRPAGWVSVPVVLTSHTYENGKNEISHQDPIMAEALMAEMADVSRVVFPADYNSALAVMSDIYNARGQLWGVVAAKRDVPVYFDEDESRSLCRDGAIEVAWLGHNSSSPRVILTAIGSYQLIEVQRASLRLAERGVAHRVVYMLEPGRFRIPRWRGEQDHLAPAKLVAELYPQSVAPRVFVVHTRPEPTIGALRPLDTGPTRTIALGFINRGGTLDANGMLFVNRMTWAHVLDAVALVAEIPRADLLTDNEQDALDRKRNPQGVLFPAA
jgi:phosphoketolase